MALQRFVLPTVLKADDVETAALLCRPVGGLGLLLLACDVPVLRKPVGRCTIWGAQRWVGLRSRVVRLSAGEPLKIPEPSKLPTKATVGASSSKSNPADP